MTIAADFDPGSGMIEQLKELAEAKPFRRFGIRMRGGHSFYISRAEDIAFTHFGSPQVREVRKTPPREIPLPSKPPELHLGKWRILNVDAIDEIILL
jgi:hypothetical protein